MHSSLKESCEPSQSPRTLLFVGIPDNKKDSKKAARKLENTADEGNKMLCQELLGQILSELELATIHRIAPESGHANSHLATTGFAPQLHCFN